ncbi:ADP-heptose synthase/D-glycero-beta-D-manno-heptose 7-phosphate kinase [Reticulomyxa filosa]|uniref:ADP-heptose synthase/D-glycero-beta-D-manno-heptose 7-phosphate kinase n=1 Tax=Reticulomyxa filosa TaxID=46433 RepID=X6NTN3_RETFI|nr:ADP-heptose synthase/D-glycero-beta-D-manno-heptose 7-phosphate kinase [Reticulomyxa filosa]|eukprot:ETO29336.1 ADP-heptose synthase/D-glycero-beta-D-manno-heptose 7-phosphate kinase [Reticulomyxa filosa]
MSAKALQDIALLSLLIDKNASSCSTEGESGKKCKVMVSGCYDLLHSGHVAFFNEAAKYGDLYVRIGSDENILLLKKHMPMFPQEERLYIVRNIRSVFDAQICSGKGFLDFEPDLDIVKQNKNN